ncbi:MAG TPA: hypothetical protein VNJ07_11375 [Chitinophagales bacterium]|nr:hypothetical protein [Chitinophagales bacterium]
MIRVGILFGGPSREREISFAGGRTVYDNLNKSLFEPVLIFVDSLKNFILLDWQYIYKGTIRDFYPPVSFLPPGANNFQIYIESLSRLDEKTLNQVIATVGKRIHPHELPRLIDFAFLTLHGSFGEDGVIQGILQLLDIPYSGSGILPSAIGMNKSFQKYALLRSGFPTPKFITVKRAEWMVESNRKNLFHQSTQLVGDKLVIRPANQGSSIAVTIIHRPDETEFCKAVDRGFFIRRISANEWTALNHRQKIAYIRSLSDIREGIGLPVIINGKVVYHPDELLAFIEKSITASNVLVAEGADSETEVVIEEFIEGKEFSCIVIRNTDGKPLALPPTEIVKGGEVYDYRSKYLAGLSRKVTPIRLEEDAIEAIRKACEELYDFFGFHVYARIDGFIKTNGTIYLNDPNTTSGMMPSSFFFHQAAEIGMNPSQFLTYIIRTSLQERRDTIASSEGMHLRSKKLSEQLDSNLILMRSANAVKKKIAVLLGGISTERHISVESGRNIYEKLASSDKYEPVPVFLTGTLENHKLYKIPINILLKDNADDIREKVLTFKKHPVVERVKSLGSGITEKYVSQSPLFEPEETSYEQLAKEVDGVFIALHGRPGEDGTVQQKLEEVNLPYNGSGVYSSQLTINKYETNQLLKKHGLKVAEQTLVHRDEFMTNPEKVVAALSEKHSFPLIAKPVDEGCSSAVKKISNKETLLNYLRMAFREKEELDSFLASALQLKPKEEFPKMQTVLIENFIDRNGAKYFLEITGGLLTHLDDNDNIVYEMFEPSETLAGGDVLSLEEKFLAGEGQNITPARFGGNAEEEHLISSKVKSELERAARILNVEGYCRIDAFVKVYENMEVETIIIEVNSLPGMTPATCIFHQAAINGYKPYEFIDKILEFSFKKNRVGLP